MHFYFCFFSSSWINRSSGFSCHPTMFNQAPQRKCVSFNHMHLPGPIRGLVVVHSDSWITTNFEVLGSYFNRNFITSLWAWDELGSCALTNAEYESLQYKFHCTHTHTNPSGDVLVRREGLRRKSWRACGACEKIGPCFTSRGKGGGRESVHGLVRCVSVWFHTFLPWQTGAESHRHVSLLALPPVTKSVSLHWWLLMMRVVLPKSGPVLYDG